MFFAIGIGIMFAGLGSCFYFLISILRYQYMSTLLILAISSFIVFIIGAMITYVSYQRSKQRDQKQMIDNSFKNVCPNCGLNLTNECQICPKCGYEIKKKGR